MSDHHRAPDDTGRAAQDPPGQQDPLAGQEVVIRAAPGTEAPTGQRRLDIPATVAGALASLGTLLLLASLAGTIGAIGYQRGMEDDDLSVGGWIAGLVILLLACLVGGWVAGRMARQRGPLHGLLSVAWLVLLAALLALLAAIGGDEYDVTDRVGLPAWFDSDAFTATAIGTGLLALLAALLGGWLGGWLGGRDADRGSKSPTPVEVVETRRGTRHRPGGIENQRRTP